MSDSTDTPITVVLADMRGQLKTKFDKMVEDPINLNNMYEHVSTMTAAIDTLIQLIEPMYDLQQNEELGQD